MDILGASGDIINGAWERVAIDIILTSSVLTAVIYIYTKVFKRIIDKKIDSRITEYYQEKKKDSDESHHEREHP